MIWTTRENAHRPDGAHEGDRALPHRGRGGLEQKEVDPPTVGGKHWPDECWRPNLGADTTLTHYSFRMA
jgi:hypothetical protein